MEEEKKKKKYRTLWQTRLIHDGACSYLPRGQPFVANCICGRAPANGGNVCGVLLDSDGVHAASSCKTHKYPRHNVVQDTVRSLAKQSGESSDPGPILEGDIRGDLLLLPVVFL